MRNFQRSSQLQENNSNIHKNLKVIIYTYLYTNILTYCWFFIVKTLAQEQKNRKWGLEQNKKCIKTKHMLSKDYDIGQKWTLKWILLLYCNFLFSLYRYTWLWSFFIVFILTLILTVKTYDIKNLNFSHQFRILRNKRLDLYRFFFQKILSDC